MCINLCIRNLQIFFKLYYLESCPDDYEINEGQNECILNKKEESLDSNSPNINENSQDNNNSFSDKLLPNNEETIIN